MYVLKRVAVKALAQQPSRQLSTLHSSSRVTYQPALAIRSFHQSRIWRAEEEAKKPAEEASPAEASTSGETVTTESSATEKAVKQDLAEESTAPSDIVEDAQSAPQTSASQDAVSEASGTTSEPLGQAEAQETETKTATEQAQEYTSSAAETVQETASSAAQTVQETASSAARSAKDAFSQTIAPAASRAAANASQALPRKSGPGRSQNAPNKILYVGNLFFEVTAAQLESEFGKIGEVTNSRVVTDSRGLSKGFGYIEFADQKAADEAVRMLDQRVFQGRRMAVQYHQQRESRTPNSIQSRRNPNPPSKTLFIGNMSYQMSDRDLNDLFRQIRNVLDVRVAIDRRSGQPRGFAHADFVDEPAATAAKEILEKKVIYGRQLKVDYSAASSTTQS